MQKGLGVYSAHCREQQKKPLQGHNMNVLLCLAETQTTPTNIREETQ